MVRRSKTIQEVIKESKIYLKNTQHKNKVVFKGSRSILETIKEGLAYLQNPANFKSKKPRREIIRKQVEIKKKIVKHQKVQQVIVVPKSSEKRQQVQAKKIVIVKQKQPQKRPTKQQSQKAIEPKSHKKLVENKQPKNQKLNQQKEVKPVHEEQPTQQRGNNNSIKEEVQIKQEQSSLNQIRRTDTQNSREPGQPVAGIIDVVFVVDTTGSMDTYLQQTKQSVHSLVDKIKQKTKSEDISVRFGFVAYRDHPPQELTYVTLIQDLCSSNEVLQFIESLDCQGGGDGAEAVFDGLNEAVTKINWRMDHKIPSLRYIFHVCDQPPHGAEFGGYSELWDNGCVCGLQLDEIAHKLNMREIHYRLIKASALKLEQMGQIFKSKFSNYDETTLQDENQGMDIRINDMVIRELLPDYDYADA